MTAQRAREALEAQGFKAPGPGLIQLVTDAIASVEEGTPPGGRIHTFDYVDQAVDTPALIDRTDGPLTDPGTEISYALADVLTKALDYVFSDEYVLENSNS